MNTFYVPRGPGLHEIACIWAIRELMPGGKLATFKFVSAFWRPVLAVAGLRVGSARLRFGQIVARHAGDEDQQVLRGLVALVEAWRRDSGAPEPALAGILRGLEANNPGDDEVVVAGMAVFFTGRLEEGRAHRRLATLEADRAELFACGRVAILRAASLPETVEMLRARGVQVLVYRYGLDIGVAGLAPGLRVDTPDLRAVIAAAGERVGPAHGDWFALPGLVARGTPDARAVTPSNVRLEDLAAVAAASLAD